MKAEEIKKLKESLIRGAFPESHLSTTLVIDLENALDLIDDFFELSNTKDQTEEEKWISVEDRLPENSIQEVIAYLNTKDHKIALPVTWRLNKFMFFNGEYNSITENITHWQPLPTPPKE